MAQLSKAADIDVGGMNTLAADSWATETGAAGDIGAVVAPVAPAPYTAPAPTDDWSAEGEQWSEQVDNSEWSAANNQWSAS